MAYPNTERTSSIDFNFIRSMNDQEWSQMVHNKLGALSQEDFIAKVRLWNDREWSEWLQREPAAMSALQRHMGGAARNYGGYNVNGSHYAADKSLLHDPGVNGGPRFDSGSGQYESHDPRPGDSYTPEDRDWGTGMGTSGEERPGYVPYSSGKMVVPGPGGNGDPANGSNGEVFFGKRGGEEDDGGGSGPRMKWTASDMPPVKPLGERFGWDSGTPGFELTPEGWDAWQYSQARQGYNSPEEFAAGMATSNPSWVFKTKGTQHNYTDPGAPYNKYWFGGSAGAESFGNSQENQHLRRTGNSSAEEDVRSKFVTTGDANALPEGLTSFDDYRTSWYTQRANQLISNGVSRREAFTQAQAEATPLNLQSNWLSQLSGEFEAVAPGRGIDALTPGQRDKLMMGLPSESQDELLGNNQAKPGEGGGEEEAKSPSESYLENNMDDLIAEFQREAERAGDDLEALHEVYNLRPHLYRPEFLARMNEQGIDINAYWPDNTPPWGDKPGPSSGKGDEFVTDPTDIDLRDNPNATETMPDWDRYVQDVSLSLNSGDIDWNMFGGENPMEAGVNRSDWEFHTPLFDVDGVRLAGLNDDKFNALPADVIAQLASHVSSFRFQAMLRQREGPPQDGQNYVWSPEEGDWAVDQNYDQNNNTQSDEQFLSQGFIKDENGQWVHGDGWGQDASGRMGYTESPGPDYTWNPMSKTWDLPGATASGPGYRSDGTFAASPGEGYTWDPTSETWAAPAQSTGEGFRSDGSYVESPGEGYSWDPMSETWTPPAVITNPGDQSQNGNIIPNPYAPEHNANYDTTTGEWTLPQTTVGTYNPNPGGVDWTQGVDGNWEPPSYGDGYENGTGDGNDSNDSDEYFAPPVAGPGANGDPVEQSLVDKAGQAAGDRLDRGGEMFRDPEEEKAYWDWKLKPAVDAAEEGYQGIMGRHIQAGTFGGGRMDSQVGDFMDNHRRELGEDYMYPYMRERGEEERADIDAGLRAGESKFDQDEATAAREFDERYREAELTGFLDDTLNLKQLGFDAADYFNEAGQQSIEQREAYERDLPAIKANFEQVMGRELTSSEVQRLMGGQDVEVMRPTSSRYATEEEIKQGRQKLTNEGERIAIEEGRLEIDVHLAMIKEWEVRGYTTDGQRIGSWLRHMEDMDFEAIVTGGGHYTRLDKDGNPIAELDIFGNPVIDENGQPVYQRVRIYGTDELADRQFIRDEDKRNGYHRVSMYVDENGVKRVQYDKNGDPIVEAVYGQDQIDRLDRERDDQWQRDKFTGFYYDKAGYGQPVWITGEVGLEGERNELQKELKQMGFGQESAERIAKQNYDDKLAAGYWGHDGHNPVYIMGTQTYEEHIRRIASDLSISEEEASLFLRTQERSGYDMIVEVQTGIDEDGEPIMGHIVRKVEGTWSREERVQSTADQLVREGWDAQTAQLVAEYNARARDRNGYWTVKQKLNPETGEFENEYDTQGRTISEWVEGSVEAENWIAAEASKRGIEEEYVKDAMSRASGAAQITRQSFVTARAKYLESTGMNKKEAYAEALKESEALNDEQFAEQYGETLNERLTRLDLDAAEKRYDAQSRQAIIQASIGAIASLGAAMFPILFGKDSLLDLPFGDVGEFGTLAYFYSLFPDEDRDKIKAFHEKYTNLLEENGLQIRLVDNPEGAVNQFRHVAENDRIHWKDGHPPEFDGRGNRGSWDSDWDPSERAGMEWTDNGGVIDVADLMEQDNWEDYLRAGVSVEMNGNIYTPEGFSDLYDRAKDDFVELGKGKVPGQDSNSRYDFDLMNPEDKMFFVNAYENAHGGDLQPDRWWSDFRGQGKRGLLKAAQKLMGFQRGFSMAGKTESGKQMLALAIEAYFNPASAAAYVAGRFFGGAAYVWSGRAEDAKERETIRMPKWNNTFGASWLRKFAPTVDGVPLHEEIGSGLFNGTVQATKDANDRDALMVKWTDGTTGRELYREDLEMFIERTGQIPISFYSFPAPQGNADGYLHLGSFLADVFDTRKGKDGTGDRWTPEYAMMDMNVNAFEALPPWGDNPVERQFPGEQVVRLIDADSGYVKVITMEEWDQKMAEFETL